MANTYDAIVVGSGACGGWAALELSKVGLKVLMLEAEACRPGKGLSPHVPLSDGLSRPGQTGPSSPLHGQ